MLSGAAASCPIIDDDPSLYSQDRTCIMLSPSAGSSLPRCRAVRNKHLQSQAGIHVRVKGCGQLRWHVRGLVHGHNAVITVQIRLAG